MRRLLLLFVFSFLAASCERVVEPIEKYGRNRYVVTAVENAFRGDQKVLQLKNKDTIFWITVLNFDAQNIKIGDTIK